MPRLGVSVLIVAARVAAVPVESKIRHNAPKYLTKSKKKFDLSEFKALGTTEDMHRYARGRLELLGRGSSRAVFSITGGKVLKIAVPLDGKGTDEAGISQNRSEVDVYTNPRTKPVVAKIYDADGEYRWLIAEAVRAFRDSNEFKRATGSDFLEVIEAAGAVADGTMTVKEAVETFTKDEEFDEDGPISIATKVEGDLVNAVAELARAGADLEDLHVNHWGKTSDGRAVVMDYGLTPENFDQFYKESRSGGSGQGDQEPQQGS